uniref:Odorant receptor n=1 Tax=Ceracris kiangsu TaxID=227354 RepID=A0A6M6DIA5_CERKI|nr:odorant receptor 10 [Ceracris kiangsu]
MDPAMSTARDAEEVTSLDYLLWPLHWTGAMCHPKAGPWACRVSYLLRFLAVVATSYADGCDVVAVCQEGISDFDRFTITLSVFETGNTWVYRRCHLTWNERKFQKFAQQVRDDFGEFMTPDDIPVLRILADPLRRFVTAYLMMGVFSVVVWLSCPTRGEGLPLLIFLPFQTDHSFGWFTGWLICAYITADAVIVNFMVDCLNVCLMEQLRTQQIVLRKHIAELGNEFGSTEYSLLEKDSGLEFGNNFAKYRDSCKPQGADYQKLHTKASLEKEGAEGSQQPTEAANSSDIHSRLRGIILHHQAILRNGESLQKCLGNMLLVQSLSLGSVLCIILVQISLSAQGARETTKICGYLFIILGELLLYCWFGDKLTSESDNLTLAIYDAVTSLDESPTSIKRSLLLLLLRSQRPLCITAAGFFPLSKESFVSILNISYSCFTVLRNFKEE